MLREGWLTKVAAKRALVVDDEKLIVKGIRFSLEQDDMQVDCAYDGEEALELARANRYDIILLDIMLPKLTGFEVCQQIREFSNVPIIMLTAKGDDMDKILGLEYGADDYITKPFNPIEVLARVKSQLRRYTTLGGKAAAQEGDGTLRNGSIVMDDEAKSVTVDGEAVSLTPIEYNILRLLMKNLGRVYSTAQIYEQVWNDPALGSENTVAVHIRHLREKIEIDPANPRYLKVVWGLGYKMEKMT